MSGAEARFELATASAAAERRSTPRFLLMWAVAAFLVALVALLWSYVRMSAAQTQLNFQRRQATEVRALVDELHRLEARGSLSDPEHERHAPNPNVVSSIENAASRAGLATPPRRPTTRTESAGNAVENFYKYTGVREQPEKLMRWVEASLAEVPGLEVWSINLEPQPADWKLDIEFRRWEFKP